MNSKKRIGMRLNACPRCGGAAYLESIDDNEWRCLQCARTVPAPTETVRVESRAVA